MKTTITLLALAMALTGCATNRGTGANYSPIVDRPGPNYAVDLEQCQQHATKVMSAADGAAAAAEGGQRGIITRCLVGRGYSVLQ